LTHTWTSPVKDRVASGLEAFLLANPAFILYHWCGNIYAITILENYSRAILASAVSRTQDETAYLMVLYTAIRQHGCPEAIVSDGGAVFKAQQAKAIYQALGIEHQPIKRRQSWQSFQEGVSDRTAMRETKAPVNFGHRCGFNNRVGW
jgi:hypothetical protein